MLNLKHTLCRTCLLDVTQTKASNIFNTADLAEKLMLCSGQPVAVNDEFPIQLCEECYAKIIIFYEFQQMCCKSMEIFTEMLNDEQINKMRSKYKIYEIDKQDKGLSSANFPELNEACEKKDIFRTATDEKETENNLEEITVIELANSNLIPEIVDSNRNDKTKNDLTEYIQVDEGYVNCENNEEIVTNLQMEEEQVDNFMSNYEDKIQEPIEEVILVGSPECSLLKESTCTDTQSYQCSPCKLKFKSHFKFKIHLRQHDGLTSFLCNFEGCKRSFKRWRSYKEHQKTHEKSVQSFKCDLDNCERVYTTKSNLNIHKRKVHNFGPKLKTHMCEICGKVFKKTSAALNDHRFTHIDKTQLPYACEEVGCGKRYSNKEKLKTHKMRHAGIKNFVCPHCGMRKTTRNELKIHINYHTLERTWPCKFCPKVCNNSGNLKVHVRNMHERAKDFACRFCERTFAKAETRKYHEMIHTGEKPCECRECGRRFVQPAALRTHQKTHLKRKINLADNEKSKAATVNDETLIVDETHLDSIVVEILSETNNS